jgi:hypothetical protein
MRFVLRRRGTVVGDDGEEDVLAGLETELPPFVPETFRELLGVSYDPDDYERHGLADSEMLDRLGRPVRTDRRFCAPINCWPTRRSVRL